MNEKRRKYTKEFIKDAVELLLRSGKTASKIVAELRIRYDLLSRYSDEETNSLDKNLVEMMKVILRILIISACVFAAIRIFTLPGSL